MTPPVIEMPTSTRGLPHNLRWSTIDEIAFVRGLGSHIPDASGDRLELLRAYDRSMSKRVHWGDINPYEVRVAVATEIAAEVRARIAREIAENRAIYEATV